MSAGILKKRFRVKKGQSFSYTFQVDGLSTLTGWSVLNPEAYLVHDDAAATWSYTGTVTDAANRLVNVTWLPATTASVAAPDEYRSTVYITSGTETYPVLDAVFQMEPERSTLV